VDFAPHGAVIYHINAGLTADDDFPVTNGLLVGVDFRRAGRHHNHYVKGILMIYQEQMIKDTKDEDLTEILPVGHPIPTDFWQSPSIESLAEAQGVQPLTNLTALFGTWPGEVDDGLEDAIYQNKRGKNE